MAASRGPRHWLMKSDRSVYSIADLERDGRTAWEGVRNYQARNFLRDDARLGDLVLFYHSNAEPSGVAGVARVCREAYPDPHAWDPRGPYHDPRSTPEAPVWFSLDVELVERFPGVVSIEALRAEPRLAELQVLRRGQRLSVMPVEAGHFRLVRAMGRKTRAPG